MGVSTRVHGDRIRDLILTTTICIRMRTTLCLVFVTVLFSLVMGKTYLVETMDKNPIDSQTHDDVYDIPEANNVGDTPEAINGDETLDDSAAEETPAQNRFGQNRVLQNRIG